MKNKDGQRDGLRVRGGKWTYRIWVQGRCYPGTTDLAATERNRSAAIRDREEHRRAILEGREFRRKLEIIPFNEAAEGFLKWVDGEYREHPRSAKRIRGSFTSLKNFFKRRPVSAITAGSIEDYKAHRRTDHEVKEVTLRHDLHALSLFFQYAGKHRWSQDNPVDDVEIPSDAESVRMHVLTPAEESAYFAACLRGKRKVEIKAHKRKGAVPIKAHTRTVEGDFRNMHDLGRLMLNQGCRPEELLELRKDAVDIDHGLLRIARGKSKAAKRTLRLTPESAFILEARMQGDSPWVFPSPKRAGHHLTKLNTAHDKVIKETGLAFVIYDFRHTCATRWAERGMDLGTLAKLLGHSSLRSVMKYVHISQEHMNQAMERYGEGHPENQTSTSEVGLRSVAATKEGLSEQMSVIEHKATGVRNLQETKGKIQ